MTGNGGGKSLSSLSSSSSSSFAPNVDFSPASVNTWPCNNWTLFPNRLMLYLFHRSILACEPFCRNVTIYQRPTCWNRLFQQQHPTENVGKQLVFFAYFIKHADHIGLANRWQTMRNDHSGAVLWRFVQGCLNNTFGLTVERRSGLICPTNQLKILTFFLRQTNPIIKSMDCEQSLVQSQCVLFRKRENQHSFIG